MGLIVGSRHEIQRSAAGQISQETEEAGDDDDAEKLGSTTGAPINPYLTGHGRCFIGLSLGEERERRDTVLFHRQDFSNSSPFIGQHPGAGGLVVKGSPHLGMKLFCVAQTDEKGAGGFYLLDREIIGMSGIEAAADILRVTGEHLPGGEMFESQTTASLTALLGDLGFPTHDWFCESSFPSMRPMARCRSSSDLVRDERNEAAIP